MQLRRLLRLWISCGRGYQDGLHHTRYSDYQGSLASRAIHVKFVAASEGVDSGACEFFHVEFVAGKYVNFVARVARKARGLMGLHGLPEVKIPEEELPVVGKVEFVEKDSTDARRAALRGGNRCLNSSTEPRSLRRNLLGI